MKITFKKTRPRGETPLLFVLVLSFLFFLPGFLTNLRLHIGLSRTSLHRPNTTFFFAIEQPRSPTYTTARCTQVGGRIGSITRTWRNQESPFSTAAWGKLSLSKEERSCTSTGDGVYSRRVCTVGSCVQEDKNRPGDR